MLVESVRTDFFSQYSVWVKFYLIFNYKVMFLCLVDRVFVDGYLKTLQCHNTSYTLIIFKYTLISLIIFVMISTLQKPIRDLHLCHQLKMHGIMGEYGMLCIYISYIYKSITPLSPCNLAGAKQLSFYKS